MTATASLRRPEYFGSRQTYTRHSVLKILRGAAWKAGWPIVKHNDRLMPYPTGGFNNANTVLAGGPLPVAGADADGGLRIIAKQPNVRFALANNATVSITVLPNTPDIQLNCPVASTTATQAVALLLADARVHELIDVTYTGTGGGLVAAFAVTAVPHVVLYGLSKTERSNADDASNDNALEYGKPEEMFEVGPFGFIYGTAPVAPSTMYLADNQTVQQNYAPLLLPLRCLSVENGLAYGMVGQP